MKLSTFKPLIYAALLMLGMSFVFTACIKKTFGPNGTGPGGGGGTGGDTTLAVDTLPSFYSPSGVAVDATGNIFVADYGNNLIRKITPAGVVSTFAGSGFEGSTDAAGLLASFRRPTGITVDPAGNVFIADAGNNSIRKITPDGTVSTFAGSDSTGSVNAVGILATFFSPTGVAVGPSGNLYVADAGNNMIRMIDPSASVTTLAANPDTGNASITTLINPTGVAYDGAGNVLIANYLGNNILSVNNAGKLTNFAGTDSIGSNNGPAASATFYFPNSVAVDAHKNVYVSDGVNNLIRKITPDGTVSTLAGSGVPGAVDSTGVNASFNGPSGIAVDAAGNVYVADSNNNLIRKITPAGVVTTVAGNGLAGSKNGIVVARLTKKRVKVNTVNIANLLKHPRLSPFSIKRVAKVTRR